MRDGRHAALQSGLAWGMALALVLAMHGAAVFLLMHRAVMPPIVSPPLEAVMLELAPALPPLQDAVVTPPAPAVVPPAPAPPPPAPAPALAPPILPEPSPPVMAEAVLPAPSIPPPPTPRAASKPQPKPKPRPVERVQARPQPALPVQNPAAAVAPPPALPPLARASAPPSDALPAWRSALLGRLQAAKRYPEQARSENAEGIATVKFTIDRAGHVLDVVLVKSAGSPWLDDEAVALVRRADPLPRIPDGIGGTTVTLTVPLKFSIR